MCPDCFIHDRESIFFRFTDQVPFWVKVEQEKQLYCEHEVAKSNKDGRQGVMSAVAQDLQAIANDGEDGLSQLRSHHSATGDRYRVTVEFCQLVTGHVFEITHSGHC